MPYFNDPNMEEDQGQGQGQQPIVSGASGVVTGAGQQQGVNGAAAGADGKGTRSGSWSNLVSYLDANKGRDAQLGQDVVNRTVGADDKSAQEAQQTFQQSANRAIQSGANRDQSLAQNISSGNMSSLKNIDKKAYTPVYNGPASADQINEYAAAQQATQKVQNTAKLLDQGSEGRGQLLEKAFGRPTYTQGERNLDSFILGGGQGGAKALDDAKSQYANYGQRWQGLVDSVNQQATQAKADTDATRAAIQAAAKKRSDDYRAQLQAKAAAENQKRTSEESDNQFLQGQTGAARQYIDQQAEQSYQDLLNRFENLSENEQRGGANTQKYVLNQLRPDLLSWQSTSPNAEAAGEQGIKWDTLGKQFYNGAGEVSADQMANADEAQGYNALMDLIGGTNKINPAQAGSRSFNSKAYQDAVMDRVNRYIAQNADSLRRRGL